MKMTGPRNFRILSSEAKVEAFIGENDSELITKE